MNAKLVGLAIAYCVVSGAKCLMDTTIVAAIGEIVRIKMGQN